LANTAAQFAGKTEHEVAPADDLNSTRSSRHGDIITPRLRQRGKGNIRNMESYALSNSVEPAGRVTKRTDYQGCPLVDPGEQRKGTYYGCHGSQMTQSGWHPAHNIESMLAIDEPEASKKGPKAKRFENKDHQGCVMTAPVPGRRKASMPASARRFSSSLGEDHMRPSTSRYAKYIFDHNGTMMLNIHTGPNLAAQQ